jgi:hypothetical protein
MGEQLEVLRANIRPWLVRLLDAHGVKSIDWTEHEAATREIAQSVQSVAALERERIVAWLRRWADGSGWVHGKTPGAAWFNGLTEAADAIERGDWESGDVG